MIQENLQSKGNSEPRSYEIPRRYLRRDHFRTLVQSHKWGLTKWPKNIQYGHRGGKIMKNGVTFVDLGVVFSKMNIENEIDTDFAAAFGHAGMPFDKLGHPSIVVLIQKYTDVAGCARSPAHNFA